MHPTNHPDPSLFLNLMLILAFLVPAVFFVLTQQNTLRTVRKENRRMLPGLVWLQFIPFFGQIWQFFVVIRIASSAVRQRLSFREDSILGLADGAAEDIGKRPTLTMGIIYCTLFAINTLYLFTTINPTTETIHGVVALVQTVCWIIYWIQLTALKRKLKRSGQ